MTHRRFVAYQMPLQEKKNHIKRRQVTEKVWKKAMVIIIYIGPSDISRTKWRSCKTGFNSLLAVQASGDQMPVFSEVRLVPHSGRTKEWQTSVSAQLRNSTNGLERLFLDELSLLQLIIVYWYSCYSTKQINTTLT